jgi:DNA-directed RNA polymerase subunit N (RpoN/RPB10)
MPLLCFQCGMPINNKQAKFDRCLLAGMTAAAAFEALGITRPCCRTNVNTACIDPRLRRRLHEQPGFAKPERASRLATKPFTLGTDGSVEPVDYVPSAAPAAAVPTVPSTPTSVPTSFPTSVPTSTTASCAPSM